MKSIAIIGAGFSGTLLTLHLLYRCPPATRVYLIEKNAGFGSGLAYSTDNPSHLLNVPAGCMSAFQDQPRHFLDWLRQRFYLAHPGTSVDEMTFVPRRLFGAYIRDLLDNELKRHAGSNRLKLVNGEVIALDSAPHRLTLRLDQGQSWGVDLAVLAIGNFPPQPPEVEDAAFYDSAYYRPDPWAADTFSHLDRTAPVLLIGTGLTMVDTVLSLLDQGHSGPVYALSRRGLLPRRHQFDGTWQPFLAEPWPVSLLSLTKRVRAEIRRAAGQGVGWRAVLNTLRPVSQALWQGLPGEQKARFLRHLRPWWDVHRHRMAPEVAERIERAQRSGQLRVGAGRIRRYRVEGGEVVVEFSRSGPQAGEPLRVQRVINCSGPACDYARIRHPLVLGLLEQGLVRPDPLRLGLEVSGTGAVVDRAGRRSHRLYALGPVTKGVFWEMTAVPDIRQQCERLAGYLAGELQTLISKQEDNLCYRI